MLKKFLFAMLKLYNLLREKFSAARFPKKIAMHSEYCSKEFKRALKNSGIQPGDSLFVMCSPDKILDKTGRRLPVHLVLNDLLDYIGESGTLMALGFSKFREEIISGERVFNLRKTPTNCGIFAELLRRKFGSVRSLQPIFSALAYGKNATEYCATHGISPYPFDEHSPFFKITQDNGKYLGIGVGIEAYTPMYTLFDCHIGEKVSLYSKSALRFNVLDESGKEMHLESFVREGFYGVPGLGYHLNRLPISFSGVEMDSGINMFSVNMLEWFNASRKLYDEEMVHPYYFNLPAWREKAFYLYRKIRHVISRGE